METASKKRIHPQMFALYVAMASIAMMFAGLTSAYIVRKSQPNWRYYELPGIFWVSTAVIVLSSITIALSLRYFKKANWSAYRLFLLISLLLGISFGVFQFEGFKELYHLPDPVRVAGNPSESFLFIIWGLHLAHIAGGLVAMLIVLLRSFFRHNDPAVPTGIAIVANYWHFVDILWLYLFFFFMFNR